MHDTAQEVHPVDGEAEHLTLAQTRTRGEEHRLVVAGLDGVGKCVHGFD